MSPLALRIRQARQRKGWSQAELARRAGIRQATVSKYERAAITSVDLRVLERLAKALGVRPRSLIG
jgi:transcriptional regulator with XRE-family HTH domain